MAEPRHVTIESIATGNAAPQKEREPVMSAQHTTKAEEAKQAQAKRAEVQHAEALKAAQAIKAAQPAAVDTATSGMRPATSAEANRIKPRIAAELAAHPHLPPPGGLLALLDAKGDHTTVAMDEIHVRLVEMRVFMDQAIREADGGLKSQLEELRGLLF